MVRTTTILRTVTSNELKWRNVTDPGEISDLVPNNLLNQCVKFQDASNQTLISPFEPDTEKITLLLDFCKFSSISRVLVRFGSLYTDVLDPLVLQMMSGTHSRLIKRFNFRNFDQEMFNIWNSFQPFSTHAIRKLIETYDQEGELLTTE